MKKLFVMMAAMSVLTSCYTEGPETATEKGPVKNDVLSKLTADQSRIVRYLPNSAATRANALTRAGLAATPPLENAPTVQELRDRGVREYDQNQAQNGGEWLITDATSADEFWPTCWNGEVTLYVAKSDIKLRLQGNANKGVINGRVFVLEKDENGNPVKNVQFPTYWPEGASAVTEGWALKVWSNCSVNFGSAFMMNKLTEFYYYGSDWLDIANFENQNPDSSVKFEAHGPVHFTGVSKVKIGNYLFDSDVVFDELQVDNKKTEMTFNGCTKVHKSTVMGNESDGLHFYVNYLLEFTDGTNFFNGAHCVFHLNNSVLVIGGEADRNNSGKNVFINGHFVEAEGNSAIFIQGSIAGEMPQLGNRMFRYFTVKEGEGNKLAVFGKRWVNEKQEQITEEPVIYIGWASGAGDNVNDPQCYISDGYNTDFGSSNVVANPADLDGDFVLDAKDPYDCRANYTWGTQPPSQDEILPPAKHKYSATGLAFDGNYVYISWHSNLPGKNREHGTNMDPERADESGYGGPSVESDEDWGGIIDIVEIDNYHPDNANLYIAGTWWNPEHKYNHVKFYGDNLYLASTSWNVGAALHVVPLIESGEGVGQTFDSANAYRINLTGKSANCVEVIDDRYLVTISGHSLGGLNWFSLSDVSNQSNKNINGETADYGGKYVFDDGNYIYALHNTDNATVTRYDRMGNQLDERQTGVSLVPFDGKNAMFVKDGLVYVCCGRNGLYVFEWNSGEMAGRSKIAANCVDVDDNGYIYVATGTGLAVYHVDNKNADKSYNTINYVAYTGKGFVYPNGWEKDGTMPGDVEKQSSNFVRVHGGKIFIAYGMYGLRIYSVDEVLNPRN
ncbi:MAG: hypothetical protein J1E04_05605 [Alistipes sp.]|nr:hypothetical protein [Alistipes sp.]